MRDKAFRRFVGSQHGNECVRMVMLMTMPMMRVTRFTQFSPSGVRSHTVAIAAYFLIALWAGRAQVRGHVGQLRSREARRGYRKSIFPISNHLELTSRFDLTLNKKPLLISLSSNLITEMGYYLFEGIERPLSNEGT